MGDDHDLSAALPEPPPPRPARREAAIDEALRHFDGAPPRAAPQSPAAPPSRPWFARPQLAAVATLALVAAIGLPVFLYGNRPLAPLDQPAEQVSPAATPKADTGSDAAPPASVVPPAAPIPAIESSARLIADAELAEAPKAAAPAPQAEARVADRAESKDRMDIAARGFAAPPPPPPPPPHASPPPPPPPPAPAIVATGARVARPAPAKSDGAIAESGAEEVVVTGSRINAAARRVAQRAAERGEWNACTINDPRRSLAACKNLINPAANGDAGRAAARVADGLSLAWRGDASGAIRAFDQAIAIAPRLSIAYLNRGLAYHDNGDTDRALADLNQAVRYDANARNYYNRALIRRQAGDIRRALADEDRAIRLDGNYEDVVP
jgi:tetratricopeptide (TPR) repeat protein